MLSPVKRDRVFFSTHIMKAGGNGKGAECRNLPAAIELGCQCSRHAPRAVAYLRRSWVGEIALESPIFIDSMLRTVTLFLPTEFRISRPDYRKGIPNGIRRRNTETQWK